MKVFLLLALAFLALSPARGEMSFSSGTDRVSLIELYTSEGCSSCPPAERWMNSLKDQPGLWSRFIPVAFHVTYWDQLGWKDVAGQDAFNLRQRKYAAIWKSGSVYTPCFVRNGEAWQASGEPASPEKIKAGDLKVTLDDEGRIEATFAPSSGLKTDYEVTVAWLGGGLRTKVKRGENSGSDLEHEFTILEMKTAPLGVSGSRTQSARLELTRAKAPRLALVAWVTKRGTLQPVQATGGWVQ